MILSRLINGFMALFFQLLYNQFAWTYDLVANIVSFSEWQDWVKSISEKIEPTSTLELGFGPGHLQAHLASKGYPIFGLDLSPWMNRITYRRLKNNGLNPKSIRASSFSIPFPDHSFNQVISTFPSEYIRQEETITEVLRVLKPGGKLVILAMVEITGKSLPHKILNLIYRLSGQTSSIKSSSQKRLMENFNAQGLKIKLTTISLQTYCLYFLEATSPES